jgi:dihydropteroate synthase
MIAFESCFWIPALPNSVTSDYLKRQFSLSPVLQPNQPACVFFRYFSDRIPASYQKCNAAFGNNCFLVQRSPIETAAIVAASPSQIQAILAFSAGLEDLTLHHELSTEIERRIEPTFRLGTDTWATDRPRIMAILNTTPDSFFDGGRHYPCRDYAEVAEQMVTAGADLIDIGGESTRPGSQPVSAAEEIQRVLPAVQQIRRRSRIPISIDTTKPEVAAVTLEAGADMINDVSGLASGAAMLQVIVRSRASYCLMHSQGKPETMQDNPIYTDLLGEIYRSFQAGLALCDRSGLERTRILLDPGIGFGKTVENNWDLLRLLPAFRNLGRPILIGTSNKSFIGKTLKREKDDRLAGTLATQVLGWMNGAGVFRAHDIAATYDALKVACLFTGTHQMDERSGSKIHGA